MTEHVWVERDADGMPVRMVFGYAALEDERDRYYGENWPMDRDCGDEE